MGLSTSPADAQEGSHFLEHRAKVAIPFLDPQVELADAGDDLVEHYHGIRGRGGVPISADHPRREDRSPEALVARGYDPHGTPYAPCGRLCRSHGYNDQADRRQYACGRPCPVPERAPCPHGQTLRGSTHTMSFHTSPRVIGPIPRGTAHWKILYAARTASERPTSYDQEVIDNARPPKRRGLKAFRFAGAIRALTHWLRRALTCIRDVTDTLGKRQPVTT